mgnify:CR=1 FL=1|jgi:hypothetical protein
MSKHKKPVDGAHLSDAIRSLQSLLDDVSADQNISDEPGEPSTDTTEENKFEDTTEFDPEATDATASLTSAAADKTDIDSHFDMNIPPALPDEDEDVDDVIPTLSETIVEGDIPVLKEIVRLPDGSTIPEPPDIDLEEAIKSGNLPTPISDAAEAASDAVQIILARYKSKPLTPEVRQQLIAAVKEILINSPELEIPDSIV